MAKSPRRVRQEVVKNPNYVAEARYIQKCAARRECHVVRLGPLVFFSTEFGDAWMLDVEDGWAACLARDGSPEPVPIVETETQLVIDWPAKFAFEGDLFTVAFKEGRLCTYTGYPVAEIERYLRGAGK